MLKKQTVWLLTMLSLMVVLSVYYLMMDKLDESAYLDGAEPSQDQPASSDDVEDNNNNNEDDGEETNAIVDNEDIDVNDIRNINPDELFTMIRMELQNERSMKEDQLKDIIASTTASTAEKNDALNDIYAMNEIKTKETILQNTILATSDIYEDVLVRHDNDRVRVRVQSIEDALTKSEVIHIMQMVRDEFGELTVDVRY